MPSKPNKYGMKIWWICDSATTYPLNAQLLATKHLPEKSAIYGFTKKLTLLSFVPKPKKNVILLTSMHYTPSVEVETNKPEIIAYYNSTKGKSRFIRSIRS
ncbi:hypothetical protein NQ318_015674 [Aromia moschata]|uniref:PiggyBac transposable element-derived protein domain-containing protein n=1 Tax=Aromia moschata TaxID=1265417 RepID=A0AAV8XQH3_9CUCU|nr:hypothetical protein NQ318_015674 [Aromia moschata]